MKSMPGHPAWRGCSGADVCTPTLGGLAVSMSSSARCAGLKLAELPFVRLYLGKCFAASPDGHAARDQFRQVIKIGQTVDMFYLVCWGLVNIAETYLEEGQIGKALELGLHSGAAR